MAIANSIDRVAIASRGIHRVGAAASSVEADGSFGSQLQSTADEFLELFGEEITYKPAGGDARTIVGIVDREGISPLPGAPHGHSDSLFITVANSATDGISADEVNTGGDMVTVARRLGQTAADRPIIDIAAQDEGMITLEIR